MQILLLILTGAGVGWMIAMSIRVGREETFLKDALLSVLGAITGAMLLQLLTRTGSHSSSAYIVIAMIGAITITYLAHVTSASSKKLKRQFT